MTTTERLVWFASHWRLESGRLIIECPPGEAEWSHYMANRGQMLFEDVTCWPKYAHRYVQTTGYGSETQLHELILKGEQNRMAAIIGLRVDRAEEWAERWRSEATQLVHKGWYRIKGVKYVKRPTRQSAGRRRANADDGGRN